MGEISFPRIKFMKYDDFVAKLIDRVKTCPQYPGDEYIDYILPSGREFDFPEEVHFLDDFKIVPETGFGGSEGIYTDVYLVIYPDNGTRPVRCHIITVKTLNDGDDDLRKMYAFSAEFPIQGRDILREAYRSTKN